MPRLLRHVTVWLLIGTVIFLALQWADHRRESRRVLSLGRDVVLSRDPDGHYRWPGRLDERPVVFLVDTGATRTAIPLALARQAGLTLGATTQSQTAGGVASGWVSRADIALEGGLRIQRLPVMVLPSLGTPLLGMDVLGNLSVHQQRGQMRIAPPSDSH